MGKQGQNGHEAPPAGFRPAGRWRWVELGADYAADYPGMAPADGAEPFRAEILVSLTGRQIADLSRPRIPYDELHALLAPCVRAWNYRGVAVGEGGAPELAAVPPPIEAGPAAFLAVEVDLVDWLWTRVVNARFEDPKDRRSEAPAADSGGGPVETEDEGALTAAAD